MFRYSLTLSGRKDEKTGIEKMKKNVKIQYTKTGNVFFSTVLKTDFSFLSVLILFTKTFFFYKNKPKNTKDGKSKDKMSAKILFKDNLSA